MTIAVDWDVKQQNKQTNKDTAFYEIIMKGEEYSHNVFASTIQLNKTKLCSGPASPVHVGV